MLIDEKTKGILKEKFERELQETTDIRVFTRNIIDINENLEHERFSEGLVEELSQITDKIKGETLSLESEEAKKLSLSTSPVILIGKDLGYSIEYWLPPATHQAGTFIETISLVSQRESNLSSASKEKLKNIDKDVLLETYISFDSPQCVPAVLLANRIAVEIPGKITSRLIEAGGSSSRARQFNISSVPQQIINEDISSTMRGFQSEEKLVNQIISYGSSRAEETLAQEKEEAKGKEELIDSPNYPIILNENSFAQAVSKYSFLVVDCWAEWCGPCQMVHPVIESLAKKYKGEITFGKLNIEENKEIASRFGIMSIPTLLVFKDGKNVDSIIGAMPEKLLEEKLNVYKPR
ncbi:MAG: thioredoxin [Candidatus Omnitrophica bacterium]|nr:thioredoxin [Candidatus Omnitrophota bacterium]